MKRFIPAMLFVGALAAQSQPGQVVSSAFGRGVTVSERDLAGTLIFALNNGMPSAVRSYEVEVWATYERGPSRRVCVVKNGEADVFPQAAVPLPQVCQLGTAVSHATRIVAVELANGWKWHATRSFALVRSGDAR